MQEGYRTQVIDQAILGMKQGGELHAEIYRALLERVYDCGYRECIRNIKEREVGQYSSRYSDIMSTGGMDPR